MKKREPVSHIMTKDLKTMNAKGGSLFVAKDLMEKKSHSTLTSSFRGEISRNS